MNFDHRGGAPRAWSASFVMLLLAGCSAARGPGVAPRSPLPQTRKSPAPGLRVSFAARSTVPYVVETLGAGTASIAVTLTNLGPDPVSLAPLRIVFTATRDGVAFPCGAHGAVSSDREPGSLAPGRSHVFSRELDCKLPLPGRHIVAVHVTSGADVARAGDGLAGTFSLDVLEARGGAGPRPYPGRAGLHVAMTGSRSIRPLSPEAWARGDYRVLVVVVNAGQVPVRVGSARLAFLTYKDASPLPCSGASEPIVLPETLAPGAMELVRAPVACAPSNEGRYEIVGRLALEGEESIEVGRIVVRVTRDPRLFAPEPWPSWGERPSGGWTR